MNGLQTLWEMGVMDTQERDELKAVLRSLRLAEAQLRILKLHFNADDDKIVELENLAVALELIVKKLGVLEA